MNYKLVPNTEGKFAGAVYDILETTTNQIIAKGISGIHNQAKDLCRHLNLGGGFDGHTPPYFLKTIPMIDPVG